MRVKQYKKKMKRQKKNGTITEKKVAANCAIAN